MRIVLREGDERVGVGKVEIQLKTGFRAFQSSVGQSAEISNAYLAMEIVGMVKDWATAIEAKP